jgi:integrase
MPDFLTRRNGTWHFVRRVPLEFAACDGRGVIKHSTKVRVSDDRTGRRAAKIALKLNIELEAGWQAATRGQVDARFSRYEDVRRHSRALGFEYVEIEQVLAAPIEKLLERLDALIAAGLKADPAARAAALGTEKRPLFALSKLPEEFEAVVADEIRDLSPEQLRIWRNGRLRAVERFTTVVGDKPINELTNEDGMDYFDWWSGRVVRGETNAKTANKDMGQLSRMLKDISTRRRLGLPDIFKGLRVRGEAENSRCPFETDFIQNKLLATDALATLNEEARDVIYVIADTGMRPSEVVNLLPNAIHLDAPIPYVSVRGDGRRLKTKDSEREIPLVGAALAAMRRRPGGFPHYRDRSSTLSAVLNKFLAENELRPSKGHTVYSLRHSFKDRLIAAEASDTLIDSLMGHKTYKPKYGKGPALDLKFKYLSQIAFTPPSDL